MQTVPASNRSFQITPLNDGQLLEVGPAASSQVGTFVIQINPDLNFIGQIAVLGRAYGEGARSLNMPAVKIPYRRVTLAGVASDYTLVSDFITGPALIQVPANGISVILEVACAAGTCGVALWDLEGSGAV